MNVWLVLSAAGVVGMMTTAIEDAKFTPVSPQRPQGAQMAVLWGDPTTGPSAMLLKSQSQAKLLQPGSHWFQPGNVAHSDACMTEQCLMYVQWAGPRDARLAEPAKN